MLWPHFYFMPCFYMCIPCFYHVCILWKMLCQKWRNKQATTTMVCIEIIYLLLMRTGIGWKYAVQIRVEEMVPCVGLTFHQRTAMTNGAYLLQGEIKFILSFSYRCHRFWTIHKLLSISPVEQCWSNCPTFVKIYHGETLYRDSHDTCKQQQLRYIIIDIAIIVRTFSNNYKCI